MVNTHGLATAIRSAQESEIFDLAGQNVTTITNNIQSAFQDPFNHANFENEPGGMIRLTFVTGAGKQARAKYDEGAARAVTSVLAALGYVEDRGASCVLECAGTFKQQHDTGKNLKTVVVFPKVNSSNSNKDGIESSSYEPIIPLGCPGYKVATASLPVFKNMITSKCPSWSDKKGCLTSLEAMQNLLHEMEKNLMKGTSLNEPEQQFYDAVVNLDDKVTHLKKEMHAQVDRGDITEYEKSCLIQQVTERISQLKKDKQATDRAIQRQSFLKELRPIDPRPLRYAGELTRLHRELVPLLKLEAIARGRLLNLQETQTLARKEEILEEIVHLEQASQGWFEDDQFFEARLEAFRDQWGKNPKKSNRKNRGGGDVAISGDSRESAINWVDYREATRAWKEKQSKEAKEAKRLNRRYNKKTGNIFSAMSVLDSEDETSSEDDNESQDSTKLSEIAEAEDTIKKKKKKRKKRRKKKSQENVHEVYKEDRKEENQDNSAADTAVADISAKKFMALEMALRIAKLLAVALFNFCKNYLIPFLFAIFAWIISQVTGKSKFKISAKKPK